VVATSGRAGASQRPRLPSRTLALAVGQLAGAALLLGFVELAVVLAEPSWGPAWVLCLWVAVAWIYLAAGVVAWLRRPSNRMGSLMIAGGFAWLTAGLFGTTVPALTAVGLVTSTLPFAVIVHMLHGFPSGRLRGRASVATVAAGYAVCVVLEAPRYLFGGWAPDGPFTLLQISYRPDLADHAKQLQWAFGLAVMIATSIVLARRLRAVPPPRRRVLKPLFIYGILAVLFVPVSAQAARSFFGGGSIWLDFVQMVVLAGVPIAFVAAMLRGGFARSGEIEELGAWLGVDGGARPALADALADALGDPSVAVAFWVPERRVYVDRDGLPVALPRAGAERAAVEVELAGQRVGAIVYDASLIADPGLVRAAGRVVAIALDNDRLMADVRAGREALRASRARLVEAADGERRRIARDLHDGLQARLVLLAIRAHGVRVAAAGQPGVRAEAAALESGLQDSIAELRELVQGVMPAALTERGLAAAVQDLVDRVPIPTDLELDGADAPLPGPVESTGYFVVSEAIANAIKHSRAHELAVRLARSNGALRIEVCDDGIGGACVGDGSGMRGMADRIDALDGLLTVDSPPDGGTSVVAEVPCGS
jgi:signal transduction histidine kinase